MTRSNINPATETADPELNLLRLDKRGSTANLQVLYRTLTTEKTLDITPKGEKTEPIKAHRLRENDL
ncbi:hypothetical protein HDV06_001316, partial [Boothiomyces sp. JEL0866]